MTAAPSQNTELEKVKERIRALSQKTIANGCSEQEAMAAMEKIGQLLEVYDLNLDEISLRDELCIKRRFELHRSTRHPMDVAAQAVADFCDCIVYYQSPTGFRDRRNKDAAYVFFGIESDVEMALYLCHHIKTAIETETEEFKRTNEDYRRGIRSRRSLTTSFQKGMSHRLCHRLNALKRQHDARLKQEQERQEEQGEQTSTALVHLKKEKVNEEAKKVGIKTRKYHGRTSIGSWRAFVEGQNAGNNVNLNRPIQGQDSNIRGHLG